MSTFELDSEFEARMFQTSEWCDEELEKSLLESGGPRDRLHVAEFPAAPEQPDLVSVLMDGHRRYRVCQKHGLPFEVVVRRFGSRASALAEMDAIQLRRRNLNTGQESLVRARLVAHRAATDNLGVERAVEAVAEQAGVATRTVWRDVESARSLDRVIPELRERAVAELTKTAIRRLGELDPEEQLEAVRQFDNGEFTSLKAAICGEKTPDDAIEPKRKPVKKSTERDAALRALGKLQDAIHDLHVASPNATSVKLARAHANRLSNLLSEWS